MTIAGYKDWEPIGIAAMIRRTTAGHKQKEVAAILGITPQYLCDILHARRGLSPEVAARLHKIGLNGRALYVRQERRRVNMAYRQEIGEAGKPWVSRETMEKKAKRVSKLSAAAYRARSIKSARTSKRIKAAALRAEAQAKEMTGKAA